MKDGMHNATRTVALWNEEHNDNKTVEEFVKGQKNFIKEFICETKQVGEWEDGELWLDEAEFRCLLCYLSPQFAMVDYHGQDI